LGFSTKQRISSFILLQNELRVSLLPFFEHLNINN